MNNFEPLIIITFICIYLIFRLYRLVQKNISLEKALSYKDSNEDDAIKEEFLKFVSDSREWAFDYIENVQKDIKSSIEIMTPVVKFIQTKNSYTYEEAIIDNVYKKLKAMLPEQEN